MLKRKAGNIIQDVRFCGGANANTNHCPTEFKNDKHKSISSNEKRTRKNFIKKQLEQDSKQRSYRARMKRVKN